jgi:hypothetical protein
MKRNTTVAIDQDRFFINGRPTYEGRTWRGHRIEGLLLNSRMVQGIFDDLNPRSRGAIAYPDGPWDAERNTREFVAAMEQWRRCGLLSFTINLQGGNPRAYAKDQPWINSAFDPDGTLRDDYTARLALILDRADELGMAPMVGYFYFGQDEVLADEAAVVRATDNATDWLIEMGYANVLVELCNESDNSGYDHAILKADRVHELMETVKARSAGKIAGPAGRLLVSASMCGRRIPRDSVIRASDYVLLHGNGVKDPRIIHEMVAEARSLGSYAGQPIVLNEDDHFDFDREDNNFVAAVSSYASWGYFDYRFAGEGFEDGYQSVPCDWGINSARKRGFFGLLAEMTGAARPG